MTSPIEETNATSLPDDEQLTIRIPNPKVYMARQSLWIGRRGKPRCDNCRSSNLKCDRVLPTCNHCSWVTGRECKYTPLPTPAHRGIPRCDRCRLKNLKCDRNLPVCNHCGENDETECNYTPKKRQRAPEIQIDRSPIPTDASRSVTAHNAARSPDHSGNGSFYGQNIASSASRAGPREGTDYSSQLTAVSMGFRRSKRAALPIIAPKPLDVANIVYAGASDHMLYKDGVTRVLTPFIEPWNDDSFAPLPDFMRQRLHFIASVDTTDRTAFDMSLNDFLEGLMGELRETACLMPDAYATVCRAVSRGDMSKLSARLQSWISLHHLCLGSDKHNLILLPRDSIFEVEPMTVDQLRQDYRERSESPHWDSLSEQDQVNGKPRELFDRLPVQTQIYDILAYAHRHHDTAFDMILEVKRLKFAAITWPMAEIFYRLCPLCARGAVSTKAAQGS